MNPEPIIWIEWQPNLYRVHDVRACTGLTPLPAGGLLPLTPPVSSILYIALTGHSFVTTGEQMSLAHARTARAQIAGAQQYPAEPEVSPEAVLRWLYFRIAHLVVQDFGQLLQPWLGIYLVKPGQKPALQRHPHHDHRVSLLENIYELQKVQSN